MKRYNSIPVIAALAAGLAIALTSRAAVAACYGGYCPNSSSPVVGGYVRYVFTTTHWCGGSGRGGLQECYTSTTYYRPFGNVSLSSGRWGANGTYEGKIRCPPNTALIELPGGYKADNGRMYNSVYVAGNWHRAPGFVCAQSDTY